MLTSAAIMAGLGLVFGTVLALANRYLAVEEDPRVEAVEVMLPGSNCGACGEPGCRGLAERIVLAGVAPSKCTVSSRDAIEQIADFLGVEAGAEAKRVARVHCGGGLGRAVQVARYEGEQSCRAAHIVGGGGLDCSWGCLGLTDCVDACTFDAMAMNSHQLPVVFVDQCTACGDCVEACPRDLIEIVPVTQNLFVQCAAPLAGDDARRLCSAACDACGRCEQDAAEGLVTMLDALPVVDYTAGGPARPEAVLRCPTGAIQWVEDQQYPEVPIPDRPPLSTEVRTHA